MAKVEIYKQVRGMPVDEFIAHMDPVQRVVAQRAHLAYGQAQLQRRLRYHKGRTSIKILRKTDVDYDIEVSHRDGEGAAGAAVAEMDLFYVIKGTVAPSRDLRALRTRAYKKGGRSKYKRDRRSWRRRMKWGYR